MRVVARYPCRSHFDHVISELRHNYAGARIRMGGGAERKLRAT